MMISKKLLSVFLAGMLLFTPSAFAFAEESEAQSKSSETEPAVKSALITMQIDNAVMTVNGEETDIDKQGTVPVIENGRTLLPVSAVVEAMGGTVFWDGSTRTATLSCQDNTIKLTIGKTAAYVNEQAETLDVAPVIQNGRTMLPIRFITERFGAQVQWDGKTKTVTIAYPGVPADLRAMYDKFLAAVDTDFAYDIAYELSTNKRFQDSPLGGRNAGSDAEHAAADWIAAQMKDIGLSGVEKAAADCDKWQFNDASLKIAGDSRVISPYSYATGATPAAGITAEVVYVGEGTMWDYEELDVTGKIVLVDVNQRDNWWITYPFLEAGYQGAAAILSANTGGFAQINKDALNANDICGPVGIPCVSISLNDSEYIQAKLKEGPVTATLKVDNEVVIDGGTTYNVLGKIKGESSDNLILIGAHYDMHFTGFQDDNCAVGLVLAMAKAMIDTGYTPKNDIVFCLHGAEEWGSSYTEFDWTVGAWEMINNVHPEWAGKILSFINFELPAYEFGAYTSTYSAPEMYSMLDYFTNTYLLSPEPEGCFPEGVKTEGYQTYTYSDDFSYYVAGVPSTVNGFLLQEDMETVFPFYIDLYHTNFDLPDTYNEAVMDFNTKYYGALAIYLDQTPALYLDFTAQYDRLSASVDDAIMADAGADVNAYKAALTNLNTAAAALVKKVEQVNLDYMMAWAEGDQDAMKALWAEGKALTKKNLDAFKFAQDDLLGLMYERPIVRHEAPQENIELMQETLACLKDGNVEAAVDEWAWMINNVLEYYSMYFSPEVIDIETDMFWGKDNQDNLYWGTGKSFVKAPVEAATRSLMEKYDTGATDLYAEIKIYQDAIASQKVVLKELAGKEITAIDKLTNMLK